MNQEQEDFAAKLILIEREAKLVLDDLRSNAACRRVEELLTVAQLLRARLNVASSVILATQQPNEEQQDFAARLAHVASEAQGVLREAPPGVVRDRLQHIASVAEILRARVFPSAGSP